MRISRFLARCGVASRRKSEEIVAAGRIALNGEIVTDLGRQIDPARDRVEVDGKLVELKEKGLTIALNKPKGVVVTRDDPQGRRTVYDLLPVQFGDRARELVYAGRLDLQTSGLLILTTDGDLVNRLVHPSRHLEKAYEVTLDRDLSGGELERLAEGIELEDGPSLPAKVRGLRPKRYEVVLVEGRNRQVRRMMEMLGAKVYDLTRTRIGALSLRELKLQTGAVVALNENQLRKLLG